MQRHSEKRNAILELLRGTDVHPDAEWVFRALQPMYPDLSLATVYRNLAQLKEAGLIRSLGKVDGEERFDGNVARHFHAVCERCGRVIDIPSSAVPVEALPEEWTAAAAEASGFTKLTADIRFSGVCADCTKGNKEE